MRESATFPDMLHAAQIRAARVLLGWRQQDLAKAAKIGLATLARIEQGQGIAQAHVATIVRIQTALEKRGLRFINAADEIGVVLHTNQL
jgi:transcriptional regulator with XRE-family HTH domain